MIDPYTRHPDIPELEKKDNNILTLETIRAIIYNTMIEVRTEQEPRWGWDRHAVQALLSCLMAEMEEKCHKS